MLSLEMKAILLMIALPNYLQMTTAMSMCRRNGRFSALVFFFLYFFLTPNLFTGTLVKTKLD